MKSLFLMHYSFLIINQIPEWIYYKFNLLRCFLHLTFANINNQVLNEAGQNSLAYLTAATHKLEEHAEALAEGQTEELPKVSENAALLQPLVPVNKSNENWPMLNQSRGVFDC